MEIKAKIVYSMEIASILRGIDCTILDCIEIDQEMEIYKYLIEFSIDGDQTAITWIENKYIYIP